MHYYVLPNHAQELAKIIIRENVKWKIIVLVVLQWFQKKSSNKNLTDQKKTHSPKNVSIKNQFIYYSNYTLA